jgi:catecholate siderophore receptor
MQPVPSTLRPTTKTGALLAGVLSALIVPGVAHAEEEEAASPNTTIIVTGKREPDANPNANPDAPYKVEKSSDGKYSEELRDTPKTITAIPKEVIEDLGATSFRDVVRTQPGVTLGTGEGGNAFGDRIFIRGFEARNDVYIDGMRDPGVTSREIFAIEQIEIVKGASSAFGGRGNTGGSVSLQSKKPGSSNFVIAEGVVGTENFYRGTIDVNRKLSDTFAVRVNGLYHNADTPGRDYVNTERYGAAASALWTPSDKLDVRADYYWFRYKGIPDYGHPFSVSTQQPFKVDGDNYYGVIGRDFIRNGADVATLDVTYRALDSLRLHTQSRYGKTYNRYVVSTPRAPCQRALTATLTCPTTGAILPIDQWTVSVGSPQRNADNRYYANMTDATFEFATSGIDHTLIAGVEFADERVSARRFAFPATIEDANGNIISAPGTFVRNLLNPNPVLGFTIPAVVDTTPASITSVKTMSVFLLDTLKFTPQLEAFFGIRYDDYAIDLNRAAGVASNGTVVAAIDLQNNVNFFNYQASLVWKPVEAGTLYASYSTSSNPSGEQLDGNGVTYNGLAATTQNLEPERNTSYELGGKLEVAGGKMLLTAAIFQTTKDNAREQVTPGVFDLVGKLRSRGFEFGVNGNLGPRLALFGGYTYLDATIRESVTAANVGKRFPNIPRHAVSLLATYKLTDDFTFGGQAYYQSRIFGGLAAAGTSNVPGYWRFDAVARYRISGMAEARVNVLNIADKRYYEAIYTSATPFTFVAPGRSANLTLALKF